MYTNSNLIEAQLQRTLTTNEETLLTLLIPAVDLWIDRHLGTTFIEEETVSSRYFDYEGRYVDIDPCTGVSAIVSVDWNNTTISTYTAGQDYLLHPENSDVKTQIEFLSGSSLYTSIMPTNDWPNGRTRIKVTAKFSEYDEGVPEDIQLAATLICSNLIARSASGQENTGLIKESIEGYSVDYGSADFSSYAFNNPIVKSILESRRELLV